MSAGIEQATSRGRAWALSHVEQLLTAVALPLVLVTTVPAGHGPSSAELALAGLTWLPLLARTRQPAPVAAVVVVLDAIHIVAVARSLHTTTLPAATLLALYTVGVRCSRRVAWSLAAAAAVAQYVTSLIADSGQHSRDLLYLNWALLGVLIGQLVRERRERITAAEARADEAERTKAAEARRQVTEERMRIARELHDVLAHHITVVNAQAGVAQYLLEADPDAAGKALAGIADNTRAALDELRATLGLLRSDSDPEVLDGQRTPSPGAAELTELLASAATGADLHTSTSGERFELAPAADLALYRITQEALTNAAKHAPGTAVDVRLDWGGDAVTLAVANTAPAAPTVPGDGTGHGLVGMRERAAAAGGTLVAAPTPAGGFRVLLTLPRVPVR